MPWICKECGSKIAEVLRYELGKKAQRITLYYVAYECLDCDAISQGSIKDIAEWQEED